MIPVHNRNRTALYCPLRDNWLPWRARTIRLLIGLVLLTTTPTRALLNKCLPWAGHWLEQPARVQRADAIVVLGGNVERIHQAISLYHQGLAPELWHTGDIPAAGESGSLTRRAARIAVEQGVPPQAIHLLSTTSTWQDGQQVVALARERQAKRILVVTDW